MFKSIKIKNFRGFQSFELQQLGRVNLLVGKNNSGKTSILEAIQLLCSRTNLEPLAEVMTNRGEYFWNDNPRGERELDVCHLYYRHKIQPGSYFVISGLNDNTQEKITFSIRNYETQFDSKQKLNIENSKFDEYSVDRKSLFLRLLWYGDKITHDVELDLSYNNGLSLEHIYANRLDIDNPAPRTILVTSSSLTTAKMTELFEELVLTPEEKLVEEALQTIDSRIERIASVNVQKVSPRTRLTTNFDSRGGFFVRLSDSKERVPIGSMGDGIWRMLGLALAIVYAKDGYLFVDEIDTGFHFTAMFDMWKMIWKTANRLNVQVFATTHNSDCWSSLASLIQQEDIIGDGIRIHRIEKGKQSSVIFNERQIVIADEREIEVR